MPYTTYDLDDLQILLAQKWEDTPFWTAEEARLAINDALCWWGLLTGAWPGVISLNSAAGEHEYALPGTLLWRTRVRVAGNTRPLARGSRVDLDTGQPTWMTETAGDAGVPSTPIVWAPISLQSIALWPAPATTGANTITVDGINDAPQLIGPDDTIDLEDGWIGPILGMALSTAAWKEGGSRWQATLPYFLAFIKAAVEQNQQLRASAVLREFLGLETRTGSAPTRAPGSAQRREQVLTEALGDQRTW